MFQVSDDEAKLLRPQFMISKEQRGERQRFRMLIAPGELAPERSSAEARA